MSRSLRKTLQSGNVTVYADPLNFANDVKMSVDTKPKRAGTRSVYNARSQIVAHRIINLPIPEGCDQCAPDTERVTITYTISGSTASKAAVVAMENDFISWLVASQSDRTSGFVFQGELLVDNVTP